jgi:Uma2 family endonuclease
MSRLTRQPIPKTKLVTFDEFCLLVREDQKADLIDGVIHMASPENTDANEVYMWLSALLYLFVQSRKLGAVYGSRVAFRLGEHGAPEPDLAFLKQENRDRVKRGYVEGPPDVAFEIVSPESIERDYEKKRIAYEAAGVSEYWIIDEIDEKVSLLRLSGSGRYREVRPRKGALHSEAMAGFWLRPEWLWQRPMPDAADTLAEIRGGTEPTAK